MFASYIDKHNISVHCPEVNIIFTENGTVNLLPDENTFSGGSVVYLITYNIEIWRHANTEDMESLILAIYLEELCHFYLNIYDEIKVKHQVYDIMHSINQRFTFDYYKNLIGWEDRL